MKKSEIYTFSTNSDHEKTLIDTIKLECKAQGVTFSHHVIKALKALRAAPTIIPKATKKKKVTANG